MTYRLRYTYQAILIVMKKSKERIQDFNKDIIDSYAKIINTSSNPDVKDVACRYIAKLATDKRLWNNDNIWNLLDKQYSLLKDKEFLWQKMAQKWQHGQDGV
jgi:hypothetical protein